MGLGGKAETSTGKDNPSWPEVSTDDSFRKLVASFAGLDGLVRNDLHLIEQAKWLIEAPNGSSRSPSGLSEESKLRELDKLARMSVEIAEVVVSATK